MVVMADYITVQVLTDSERAVLFTFLVIKLYGKDYFIHQSCRRRAVQKVEE